MGVGLVSKFDDVLAELREAGYVETERDGSDVFLRSERLGREVCVTREGHLASVWEVFRQHTLLPRTLAWAKGGRA